MLSGGEPGSGNGARSASETLAVTIITHVFEEVDLFLSERDHKLLNLRRVVLRMER